MSSNLKYPIFLAILMAGITGCKQALYFPGREDSVKTGISADSLVLGRNLYVNNCGSCHSLFLPERFTAGEWTKILSEMQKKAKCSNQETDLINNYLKVRSKQD
jgi:hypothetical protein